MLTRRSLLELLPSLGITSTVFGRALVQQAAGADEITAEMVANAQWISGIELTPEEQTSLATELNNAIKPLAALRGFPLDPQHDGLPTALVPHQRPLSNEPTPLRSGRPRESVAGARPDSDDALAFYSVVELSALLRTRQISSVELTNLYLERLKKYDPLLKCVVTLTEDLALKQAQRADADFARGVVRSSLQGIPWGAKDLISVPGYPTTWGIPVFRDRVLPHTATVAERLEAAGAVLVAKLSLGAIAMGDRWFGGMTRNPWNPKIGSSGSSAGSAAATAAGLVGFSIGSETLGSILSPSQRCGTCGLRPTFGRVSRHGCMPLSYTMDKIGPIARSVEDLALIFDAIHGVDPADSTTVMAPFRWPTAPWKWSEVRIGYLASPGKNPDEDENLKAFREWGCQLVEVQLPADYPLLAMTKIIDIEGASVFQDLLKAGETEGWNTWTKTFQGAQFIPAVDYLRMQRVREKLMRDWDALFQTIDVLWDARDLMHTNFTGHPSVTLPWKHVESDRPRSPQSVVLTGRLYEDERLLAIAAAFQDRLSPLPPPPVADWLTRWQAEEVEREAQEKAGAAPQDSPPKTTPPNSGG